MPSQRKELGAPARSSGRSTLAWLLRANRTGPRGRLSTLAPPIISWSFEGHRSSAVWARPRFYVRTAPGPPSAGARPLSLTLRRWRPRALDQWFCSNDDGRPYSSQDASKVAAVVNRLTVSGLQELAYLRFSQPLQQPFVLLYAPRCQRLEFFVYLLLAASLDLLRHLLTFFPPLRLNSLLPTSRSIPRPALPSRSPSAS